MALDKRPPSCIMETGHKNRGAEGHPRLRSKQTAVSGRLEPDPGNAGVGSFGAEMRNWETLARPQFADAPVFMLRHKKGVFLYGNKIVFPHPNAC